MPEVKIAYIQMSCTLSKAANMEKLEMRIQEASNKGAQVVVTQELVSSLYFCDVEDYNNFGLAEPIPGPGTVRIGRLAAELRLVIVVSLFEKRAEGLYHNTTAVLDADGTYLGKYRKMHIPDDPGFYEKFYFTPGDLGYKVFKTRYLKIGVLICWDQWYPEAARLTALMGAELLVYPTAIGWAQSQNEETNKEQFEAWQTMQRSHAVANGLHVVAVNRVGIEANVRFWGGSFISGPFGKVLHQSPHDLEEVWVESIETEKTGDYRVHWPFLRDRRIDSYGGLTERYLDGNT